MEFTPIFYISITVCIAIVVIYSIIMRRINAKHHTVTTSLWAVVPVIIPVLVALFIMLLGIFSATDWHNSSTSMCHNYNTIALVLQKNWHLRANVRKAHKQWADMPTLEFHNPRIGRMRLSTYLRFKKQHKLAYQKYQTAKQKMGDNMSNLPLPSTYRSDNNKYQSMRTDWISHLFIRPSIIHHDEHLVDKSKARITPTDKQYIRKYSKSNL